MLLCYRDCYQFWNHLKMIIYKCCAIHRTIGIWEPPLSECLHFTAHWHRANGRLLHAFCTSNFCFFVAFSSNSSHSRSELKVYPLMYWIGQWNASYVKSHRTYWLSSKRFGILFAESNMSTLLLVIDPGFTQRQSQCCWIYILRSFYGARNSVR